jgi:hypothetical protein
MEAAEDLTAQSLSFSRTAERCPAVSAEADIVGVAGSRTQDRLGARRRLPTAGIAESCETFVNSDASVRDLFRQGRPCIHKPLTTAVLNGCRGLGQLFEINLYLL